MNVERMTSASRSAECGIFAASRAKPTTPEHLLAAIFGAVRRVAGPVLEKPDSTPDRRAAGRSRRRGLAGLQGAAADQSQSRCRRLVAPARRRGPEAKSSTTTTSRSAPAVAMTADTGAVGKIFRELGLCARSCSPPARGRGNQRVTTRTPKARTSRSSATAATYQGPQAVARPGDRRDERFAAWSNALAPHQEQSGADRSRVARRDVEGRAAHRARRRPRGPQDKRLISLDMGALIAGAKYPASSKNASKPCSRKCSAEGASCCFVDELHTVVGAGKTEV